MDGLPGDVHRGHASRSQNHDIFAGMFPEVFKQGGFAGAGPAGDEDVFGALLHEIKGLLKLLIEIEECVRVWTRQTHRLADTKFSQSLFYFFLADLKAG